MPACQRPKRSLRQERRTRLFQTLHFGALCGKGRIFYNKCMHSLNDLVLRSVSIDWSAVEEDSYVRSIPAIANLSFLPFSKPITFFAGENGSGKSTLLEAIAAAYGFNPEGGTRNYNFSTRDSHSGLFQAIRLSRSPGKSKWGYFLRAESFYNVASMDEIYGKGPGGVDHHYHEKSHGESFLALAQDNFGPSGLYLLDEPEAALSPQRQLSLLIEIFEWAREGAQFIIATHSPILLAMPDSEIKSFDDGEVHTVDYEDTDSYRITSQFLGNRKRFLKELLGEDFSS